MKAQRRNRGISYTLSLTSALDGVGGIRYVPDALPPGKRPDIHCIGGWVGPRASLDATKYLAPPGFDPHTIHPVARSYTHYAVPALEEHKGSKITNWILSDLSLSSASPTEGQLPLRTLSTNGSQPTPHTVAMNSNPKTDPLFTMHCIYCITDNNSA